jgi:uncharacterized membrane protein YgcG
MNPPINMIPFPRSLRMGHPMLKILIIQAYFCDWRTGMNARLGLAVVLTLFAGLYCFPGTAYSQVNYYTCYAPDGTYFESATPCNNSYDYDSAYPYYDYYDPGFGLGFGFGNGYRDRDRDRDSGGGGGGFHEGGGAMHGGGEHEGGGGSHGGGGHGR